MEIPKITKETRIKQLLKEMPEAAEILMAYGLQCVNCYFSEHDTLENGADIHGLNKGDVEMIVRDLNKILRERK